MDEPFLHRKVTRRFLLAAAAQSGLGLLLLGRLYTLQVAQRERFAMLAEDNRIKLSVVPPPRGSLLDRNGQALAGNQQNYRLLIERAQVKNISQLEAAIYSFVVPDPGLEKRLRKLRDYPFAPLLVREHLSWEELSSIEVRLPYLPGVFIDVGRTRFYPEGSAAAHLLGYVSQVSKDERDGDPLLLLPGFRIGKSGLEKQYERRLRGHGGSQQVEVNALGRVVREISYRSGRAGKDVALACAAPLQRLGYRLLAQKKAGALVVLDIQEGGILAQVSVPSFDPNLLSRGISKAEWQALIGDPLDPLTDRAISGTYTPGSALKMVVALAALEAGIHPAQKVFCSGRTRLGRATFHCWKRGGHGRMNMSDGIIQSCDSYFYELGRQLGIEKIAEMARRFGLGRKIGLGQPSEAQGLVPDKQWKLDAIGEPWQAGETLVSAIGQGFILATPMQLAVMVASLARGSLVHPRSVLTQDELQAPPARKRDDRLGVAASHLEFIRQAMWGVVNSSRGTARASRIPEADWTFAGKTGTSQVRRISAAERAQGVIKNADLPWQQRDHGLFVGFAPMSAPRYACAVVVEHGGSGSRSAAPIARDLLNVALRSRAAESRLQAQTRTATAKSQKS